MSCPVSNTWMCFSGYANMMSEHSTAGSTWLVWCINPNSFLWWRCHVGLVSIAVSCTLLCKLHATSVATFPVSFSGNGLPSNAYHYYWFCLIVFCRFGLAFPTSPHVRNWKQPLLWFMRCGWAGSSVCRPFWTKGPRVARTSLTCGVTCRLTMPWHLTPGKSLRRHVQWCIFLRSTVWSIDSRLFLPTLCYFLENLNGREQTMIISCHFWTVVDLPRTVFDPNVFDQPCVARFKTLDRSDSMIYLRTCMQTQHLHC